MISQSNSDVQQKKQDEAIRKELHDPRTPTTLSGLIGVREDVAAATAPAGVAVATRQTWLGVDNKTIAIPIL